MVNFVPLQKKKCSILLSHAKESNGDGKERNDDEGVIWLAKNGVVSSSDSHIRESCHSHVRL